MMRFVDEEIRAVLGHTFLDSVFTLSCNAAGRDDYLRSLKDVIDILDCVGDVLKSTNDGVPCAAAQDGAAWRFKNPERYKLLGQLETQGIGRHDNKQLGAHR